MIKTCQDCFAWAERECCCSILKGGYPQYPNTCRFWKHTDSVSRLEIEHDIAVYAGLRTKEGD